MKLTETQQDAVEGIIGHLRSGNRIASLVGYAGTGKTTLLMEVYKELPETIFLTPTHKAKGVLFKKLCKVADTNAEPPDVRTVTSFLKDFKGTKEECMLQTIDLLEMAGKKYKKELRKWYENLEKVRDKGQAQDPVFADKEDADADTIVCDEASMITRTDRNAIELRCRAGVMVGDGFQAPPVVSRSQLDYEDWFGKAKHNWALTEVLRNDEGVLKLATIIRKLGGDDKVDLEKTIRDLNLPDLKVIAKTPKLQSRAADDNYMFLSFMNKNVDSLSFGTRRALGREPNCIDVDDRLYANNSFGTIVNKTELAPKEFIKLSTQGPSYANVLNIETGEVSNTMINPARLLTGIPESERKRRSSDKGLIARYDYARTIHGAQGSEWKNVVYQHQGFEWMTTEQYNRLVYTAVTRAQKNFALLKS